MDIWIHSDRENSKDEPRLQSALYELLIHPRHFPVLRQHSALQVGQ
jgi:hypothetical protein